MSTRGPPRPRPSSAGNATKPSNPFEALKELRDALPPSKPERRAEDFPETPPADGPARAVVRVVTEADGEHTRVEELGLDSAAMEQWRLALQRGLATRVTITDGALSCQGDHRLALPDLLLARGVQRVVFC